MWRVCYPIGIHFGVTQLISFIALQFILAFTGEGTGLYYRSAIWLTGVVDLVVFALVWPFYRQDHSARMQCGVIEKKDNSLFGGEMILLFLLGAALSFYVNELIWNLSFLIDSSEYIEQMEKLESGYSLFSLIFWMSIVAPIAEEAVFRRLVFLRLRDYLKHAWVAALISGLAFGVYQGNVPQAVYASVLGFLFAMLLEWTGNKWSTVWLHIGANFGSIFLSEVVADMPEERMTAVLIYMMLVFLAVLIFGFRYFVKMGRDHTMRLE